MPLVVIAILFGVSIFFFALYMVVKAAVNNSEAVREIRVMLMKAQNDRD
jgi:hypothetical protein